MGQQVLGTEGTTTWTPKVIFVDESKVKAHHRMIVKKGATLNDPSLTVEMMSKHNEVKEGDAILMHYGSDGLREVVNVIDSRVQDGYLYATVAVK